MKNNNIQSKITGCFFIIAAVSSIIGLKLYDPILVHKNYVVSASSHSNQIIFGAINELILAASATGTGIMLFPLLKRYNESVAFGYISFRILEVVFIVIGTVSVLSALSISEYYVSGTISSNETAQYIILTLKSIHKWTFILGPNFMLAINTFLYSYAFFKLKAIPKNLTILGMLAAIFVMTAAMLELFGIIDQISFWGIMLAVPIALYEMTLATWLIIKGVRPTHNL